MLDKTKNKWYTVLVAFKVRLLNCGEVSEWFKELVLKTSDAKAPRVRISASPPFNPIS